MRRAGVLDSVNMSLQRAERGLLEEWKLMGVEMREWKSRPKGQTLRGVARLDLRLSISGLCKDTTWHSGTSDNAGEAFWPAIVFKKQVVVAQSQCM